MTLVATPGAADANSYTDVAEADAYHAMRLHNAAWSAASTPTKESALQWATRLLDLEDWVGYRVTPFQGLRWPRSEVYDRDDIWVPQTVVPKFLKDATAELAFLLIPSDRTAEAGTEGFSKIVVGPIELDVAADDRVETLSPEVWKMIEFYLDSGPGSVRIHRG